MSRTPPEPVETIGGGRYALGAQVRSDGPIRLCRAVDTTSGRSVTVKLAPSAGGEREDVQWAQELRVLRQLRHPQVTQLLDTGTEAGRRFAVLSTTGARSLVQRIVEKPLSPRDVTLLGSAVGHALAHVHSRGIVHRNVKPAAVLIDANGFPELCGFDIALCGEEPDVLATPGMVYGSPPFMSPEQVVGERPRPPSDVYALGLVLLACLTGKPAFEGATAVEIAAARLHRSPVVPDLPDHRRLHDLIVEMTARNPAARPTASEAATALGSSGTGHPRERLSPSPRIDEPVAPAPAGVDGPGATPTDVPASVRSPEARPDGAGVFISYRRTTSWHLARLLHGDLSGRGYDVFMDVADLDRGDFADRVLREIDRRAHFIVVLQPGTRFEEAGHTDWMRREIAHALTLGRNVVPVMADGFRFSTDDPLPADISRLATANGVTVYPDYVDEALVRLHTRFLGP